MRNVKNITVAVSVDLYRQTRKLAAEYDTTVTAMVAYLLQKLPDALKRAQFPVGGPKWAPATRPKPPAARTAAAADSPTSSSMGVPPSPPNVAISPCEAVNPNLNDSLSAISGRGLHTDTAPVSQYADSNQHMNNDLPKSRTAAVKQ
jgi:hypothetical protein